MSEVGKQISDNLVRASKQLEPLNKRVKERMALIGQVKFVGKLSKRERI